ncbi:MAG: hypothetical protein JNJ54_04255 [Myxococcaceae bacterium]|nr:hypothetical protein [Myxococcaceae bacterium]
MASDDRSNVDLYGFPMVMSLAIHWGDDGLAHLELVLQGEKGRRTIRAAGVRNVRLPEVVGRLWLPELEIEDWSSRGLEGIRYHLVSRTTGAFQVLCRDLIVA